MPKNRATAIRAGVGVGLLIATLAVLAFLWWYGSQRPAKTITLTMLGSSVSAELQRSESLSNVLKWEAVDASAHGYTQSGPTEVTVCPGQTTGQTSASARDVSTTGLALFEAELASSWFRLGHGSLDLSANRLEVAVPPETDIVIAPQSAEFQSAAPTDSRGCQIVNLVGDDAPPPLGKGESLFVYHKSLLVRSPLKHIFYASDGDIRVGTERYELVKGLSAQLFGEFQLTAGWSGPVGEDEYEMKVRGLATDVLLNGEQKLPIRWPAMDGLPVKVVASGAGSLMSAAVGFAFGQVFPLKSGAKE